MINEPLAATATLLEAIVESMPDGILVVDQGGHIRMMNMRAEALFQYGRSELLGRPIEELLPERFRATHIGSVRAYWERPHMRTMGSGLDLYGLRRDGSEFPADVALSPLDATIGCFVISSVRDMTERRSLEDEQRRLEAEAQLYRERERIALELHDTLIQVSYGVGLNLATARQLMRGASRDAEQVIDDAISDLDSLIRRVRSLILDLTRAGAAKVETMQTAPPADPSEPAS